MKKGIIGKKIGMTQIFDEIGNVIPVTVIEAGPCVVTQKKTAETDGYEAVQLGFVDAKEKQLKLQFDKGDILPEPGRIRSKLWVTKLFEQGRIDELDRVTVAEILDSIYVYPDGRIEINYRFSNTAESRLEHEA